MSLVRSLKLIIRFPHLKKKIQRTKNNFSTEKKYFIEQCPSQTFIRKRLRTYLYTYYILILIIKKSQITPITITMYYHLLAGHSTISTTM